MPYQKDEPFFPKLIVPGAWFLSNLNFQIEEGSNLIEREVIGEVNFFSLGNWTKVDAKLNEAILWHRTNYELFKKSFENQSIANDYRKSVSFENIGGSIIITRNDSINARINTGISFLKRIIVNVSQLSDTESRENDTNPLPEGKLTRLSGEKVFIIHGRDIYTKEMVARFVEQLGLKPIVLQEQANEGKAIIEKLEVYSDVIYAIVLLTPDDVGFLKGDDEKAHPRARQNVIFELGYFIAHLGRNRVCVLNRGDIEIPSDYSGILNIPLDNLGAWRLLLAREMKIAGLPIDMNLVL
jgi:predicted nucleotide-binding protein